MWHPREVAVDCGRNRTPRSPASPPDGGLLGFSPERVATKMWFGKDESRKQELARGRGRAGVWRCEWGRDGVGRGRWPGARWWGRLGRLWEWLAKGCSVKGAVGCSEVWKAVQVLILLFKTRRI